MSKTTLEKIDSLLESVVAETDDSEIHYKLQSARQLVAVVQQRHQDLDEALDEAVTDDEVMENLRELGYVE